MIVSTVNVNGIRAAAKQQSSENLGLLPWLAQTRADAVCLQETRADDDQLAGVLRPALFHGPPRTLGVRPGIWRRRAGTSRAAMVLRCLWWSWRGRAFDNDAGWRIDYQLATRGLAARADAPRVERASAYALRWSDHAPVTVEYR